MCDYEIHRTIADMGALDRVAFLTALPVLENGTFTLCFWFLATEQERRQVLLDIESTLALLIEDSHLIVLFSPDSEGETAMRVPLPALNAWHHVAVTLDTQMRLYIEGEYIQCIDLKSAFKIEANGVLRVGGYTDPAGGHYDYTFGRNQSGWLNDLRCYSRVLSEAEIRALIPPASDDVPDVEIEIVQQETGIVQCNARLNRPDTAAFYLWDFGDGQTATGQTVQHHHAFSGTYLIKLRAVSGTYQQSYAERSVQIQGASTALTRSPVFVNGTEGHACYRIPSIICAANGDLLAFAEARLESCSDSTKTIRLVYKRSTDGGKTWLPLQIIARNLIDGEEFAVQQNAPVVDRVHSSGRIIVLYNKLEVSEFDLAAGQSQSRIFCMFSDDHGATWYGEKDISAQVHRPELWRVQRPTLGHAIQLRSGRLLFAGMMTAPGHSVFASQNYLFWSDDAGEHWAMSAPAPYIGLNEATAAELDNGAIMINSRAYHNEVSTGKRAVTIAHFTDDNVIFEETYFDEALIDPAVQASLIRYTSSAQQQYGGKSRLLFCNPMHQQARYNLTMRLSYDDGKTWAVSKTLDAGAAAYSDIVIQKDMQIGVLYEQGNQGGIVYSSFTLDWLTDGQDHIGA